MIKNRTKIAHIFVLETIEESVSSNRIEVKPMFGSHSIYIDGKIMCTLRHRPKSPRDNGIWIVMSSDLFDEVKKELPSLRSIDIFKDLGGEGFKAWANIPEEGDDFESEALQLCQMVIEGDPRIGKFPQSKLRATKSKSMKRPAKKKVRKSR